MRKEESSSGKGTTLGQERGKDTGFYSLMTPTSSLSLTQRGGGKRGADTRFDGDQRKSIPLFKGEEAAASPLSETNLLRGKQTVDTAKQQRGGKSGGRFS